MNKEFKASDIAPPVSHRSPYFSEEHEMLRDQVRRFVDTEIKPHALAWEEQGMVPREVLRRMGSLGFFGIRYPAKYGGSEMDTIATAVYAEELGRSTFGGVAITALVHTDMASVHVFNAGSEAQKDKWMPRIIAGEVITAVAVSRTPAPTSKASAPWRGATVTLTCSTAPRCSSPTASTPTSIAWRRRPRRRDGRASR
jgi:alkylation response protein AidB-like acyl-CoA dehydrogenase